MITTETKPRLLNAVPRWLIPAGFAALTALAATACSIVDIASAAEDEPRPGDLTVLFIGSSYFDVNDMPGIFENLAATAGKDVYVRRVVRSGHYLDYFAQDATTAAVIRERAWDYVILQGGCQNAAYPREAEHEVYPAVTELKRKIDENDGATRTVYMMPWAFEDGMTWVEGYTDEYDDMQLKIRDNAVKWAGLLGMATAPVGMAWYEVLQDHPQLHYLHLSDWNHPSQRGSYLSAAVIYATVFVECTEGVQWYGGLSQDEAELFQEVASRTVLDNLAQWNITWGG